MGERPAWERQYIQPVKGRAPIIQPASYEVYPETEEFIEEIKQATGDDCYDELPQMSDRADLIHNLVSDDDNEQSVSEHQLSSFSHRSTILSEYSSMLEDRLTTIR